MNGLVITPKEIYDEVLDLPQDSLSDLAAFVQFLRFRVKTDIGVKERGESSAPPPPAEFLQAVAAFDRLKPQLLNEYAGRVVAVYQDRVVAVGNSRLDVLDEVTQKYGHVPCYIEWVEPETPRRVRMPSAWVE